MTPFFPRAAGVYKTRVVSCCARPSLLLLILSNIPTPMMKVFSLFSLLLATITAAFAALVGSGGVPTCTNEQVAYETYIGKDHNVKVSYSQCDEDAATAALAKRQSSNVCGAACEYML